MSLDRATRKFFRLGRLREFHGQRSILNIERAKDKARSLELKGSYDKAVGHYMKILGELEGTPDLIDELGLYNKVGDLYLKLGNVTAAVEEYEKAIKHYSEQGFPNNAIALCNKVLRNAPGRTHIYLKLAKLMLQRGFVAESKQNLLEYAERMQKSGKLEEAFHALREFADLSPDNEEIRLLLAEQLKKAARTEEAREQLTKLYQEVVAMGDSRKARQTLSRMKAIDPEYDVEDAPPAAVKSKKTKSTDIVFINLDEDVPPEPEEEPEEIVEEPPTQAVAMAEPDELQFEPTAVGESVEVLDEPGAGEPFDLERVSEELDVERVGMADMGQLEGLQVEQIFRPDEEMAVDALDVEPTMLDDSLVADEVPEGGDLPLIAPASGEAAAFADGVSGGFGAIESGVEVPDLDMGFHGELGDISFEEEEGEGVTETVDLPMLDTAELEEEAAEEEVVPAFDTGREAEPEGEIVAFEGEELEEVGVAVADDSGALEVAELVEPGSPDISRLEDMILDDPDAPAPHRELGEALLEGGERERGIEELDISLTQYEARGDWQHAEAVAEEILRVEPNSVYHHQKRVEYAFRSGDKDTLAEAYLELADALVRDGSIERACSVYERVLDHDPDNFRAKSALETLGPAQVEELEIAEPEVEEELEETYVPEIEPVASKPALPEPLAAAMKPPAGDFVDLGALIMDEVEAPRDTRMRIQEEEPTGDEERDFQEMLSEFKKGIEANVALDDSQAHYDLGIAFKEMGLLDEAISEFQKALRSAEGRLKTAEALGLCFYEKGQFAVAATVLRRAAESERGGDDDKIGVLYWLGRCEEEQGNPKAAIGYYQRIFSVDIGFQDVRERVKKLTGTDS